MPAYAVKYSVDNQRVAERPHIRKPLEGIDRERQQPARLVRRDAAELRHQPYVARAADHHRKAEELSQPKNRSWASIE